MRETAHRKLRVYADTSVYGGCEDEEFREHSRRFIGKCKAGEITLVTSYVVAEELERAPFAVREVPNLIPDENQHFLYRAQEIERLADSYMAAGVLSSKMRNDALHIAAATVAGVDIVVSWNLKHMANTERIRRYNEVNLRLGYTSVKIVTPEKFNDGKY